MNNISLVGRMTKDVDLKTFGKTTVGKFTLAVDRMNKKELEAQGKETADFINCTTFGKMAEILAMYSGKGLMLGVIGRLQTGSYEKEDGTRVFITDVIVNQYDIIEWKKTNESDFNVNLEPEFEEVKNKRIPF